MNKKTCLIIFLALLVGEIAGYTSRALTSRSRGNSEKQAEDQASVRPRFGSARQEDSPSSPGQKGASLPGKSEVTRLDDTLRRYARMSTEELWQELEMLNKQTDRHTYSPNTAREILKSYIFTRLGQEAPRQTLALTKDKKSIFSDYRHAIIEAWCSKNPEAAMAYCRENMEGDSEECKEWKISYVDLLTKSSPDKAIDYLFTLSPQECATYAEEVAFRLAAYSPEKMTGFMEKIAPMINKQGSDSGYIVSKWAQYDWDAAEKWIKTLPAEKQSRIMSWAMAELPQEEAQKRIDALDEKSKQDVLAKLGVSYLAHESPVKVLDIILKNTTEEQAVTILERGFYALSFHNDEVRSYMSNLPSGAVKDGVLERVIRSQSSSGSETEFFNPKIEDTFSLINQMSSAEKKEEVAYSSLESWFNREPLKVKSWVEQSGLSDDKKRQLIQRCDNAIKSQKVEE